MLQAAQSEGDLLGLRGSAMLMGLGFGFHVCGIAFCLLALGLAVGRERWPGFGVVALGWRNCRWGGGALRLKGSRYGRMALASYQVVAKLET